MVGVDAAGTDGAGGADGTERAQSALPPEAVAALRGEGLRVATGRFGADMRVSLVNDGPFTVLVDT